MPVNENPQPAYVPARKLREFVGQTIDVQSVRSVKRKDGTTAVLMTLRDGVEVWTTPYVAKQLTEAADPSGHYVVESYPTDFGNDGYALRNVH